MQRLEHYVVRVGREIHYLGGGGGGEGGRGERGGGGGREGER